MEAIRFRPQQDWFALIMLVWSRVTSKSHTGLRAVDFPRNTRKLLTLREKQSFARPNFCRKTVLDPIIAKRTLMEVIRPFTFKSEHRLCLCSVFGHFRFKLCRLERTRVDMCFGLAHQSQDKGLVMQNVKTLGKFVKTFGIIVGNLKL